MNIDPHTFGGSKASETLAFILNTKMIEMLRKEKDVEWLYYPNDLRFGRLIVKEKYLVGLTDHEDNANPERTHWVSNPAWKFTDDKEKLLTMIPKYE